MQKDIFIFLKRNKKMVQCKTCSKYTDLGVCSVKKKSMIDDRYRNCSYYRKSKKIKPQNHD